MFPSQFRHDEVRFSEHGVTAVGEDVGGMRVAVGITVGAEILGDDVGRSVGVFSGDSVGLSVNVPLVGRSDIGSWDAGDSVGISDSGVSVCGRLGRSVISVLRGVGATEGRAVDPEGCRVGAIVGSLVRFVGFLDGGFATGLAVGIENVVNIW